MHRVQRAIFVAVLIQCCTALDNRPRRQFPTGEWVPISQPCPTCRPVADPGEVSPSASTSNVNDIGLVPPRAPLASRQVHGTGNFFQQNFPQQFQQRPFNNFPSFQFNQQQQQFSPPTQQFFPPQSAAAFLPQTYLNNPQLLLNENPQLLPLVTNPQLLLSQQQQQQQQQKAQAPAVNAVPNGDKANENQIRFKTDQEKSSTKVPQDIRLEQEVNSPQTRLQLPFNQPHAQFLQTPQFQQNFQQQFQQQQFQQQPQTFQRFQQFPSRPEQQSLLQVNPGDPFLTPPPFRNNSDIQIPGLEKEEIQLLYVPVETLRQRGHLQGHQVDEAPQFIQSPNGHFITQNTRPQFPQIPPPAVLTQGLPLRDAPQQFANPTERPTSPPTTEQIVTIQPRPVSTVRQLSETQRRPVEQLTTIPQRTTFLSNEHLTKVTESLPTEVTRPIPQTTVPPTTRNEQIYQEQQFQNLRSQTNQQLRASPEPEFETRGSPIPQIQTTRHRFTPTPRPEFTTEQTLPTTTLQPHQPPLAIYMRNDSPGDVRIVDVLRALKGAPSIAVIDTISSDNPLVYVGPYNLNAPSGIGKFELPYLSNLEQNQRTISVPFFVAPLNFIPPQGYTKIPFPAPHVGSVVVSTDISEQTPVPEVTTLSQPSVEQFEAAVTAIPETTTTIRSRGRRPNNYRPASRKPVNSRQRATVRPLGEETTQPIVENQVSSQDFLREHSEERRRPNFPSRRQRFRTTTESIQAAEEPVRAEEFAVPDVPRRPVSEQIQAVEPPPPTQRLVEPVLPPVDFTKPQAPVDIQQVLHREQLLRRPTYPESDFNPPPPSPSFEFRPPQLSSSEFTQQVPNFQEPAFTSFQQPQQQENIQQLPPSGQETQGLFEVPAQQTRPQPEEPVVETNGDSGFQNQNNGNLDVTTSQPISSTQFFENLQSQSPSEESSSYSTETSSVRTTTQASTQAPEKEPEIEETEKVSDVPRKTSRYPNVPGVKSYPNPGAVKQRSHLRSRPRYTTPSTTTKETEATSHTPDDDTSSPATEVHTTSRYQSHFNRQRKPLRTSTAKPETTTTSSGRSAYTVRPLRRSTVRTSVATKRIRKPTSPSPLDTEEEDNQEPQYAKKTRPDFSPSGVSNEVYDEQRPSPVLKAKKRKPYFPGKQSNVEIIENPVTSPSPLTTKTYQERVDEGTLTEIQPEQEETIQQEADSDVNESKTSTTAPSGPSGPSDPDDYEKKGANDDRKKARDPELTKKPRRRLRVRVQKRPHDNFETAESQNHGSLSNALIKATPTPELYHFSQDASFDSNKFTGTQHKGHVRNITTDILESTSTFSSPGTDTQVHHVTIASEPTTVLPETLAPEEPTVTHERTQPVETTTIKHTTTTEPVETTTFSEEVASTVPVVETSSQEMSTNAPISEEVEKEEEKQKSAPVVRTSTTTKVSHETEICYKGKCIKTNSDNPDKALRDLVDSAHSEEAAAKS